MFVMFLFLVFFFKQKTAYEMRISDWSSDVCSSDLRGGFTRHFFLAAAALAAVAAPLAAQSADRGAVDRGAVDRGAVNRIIDEGTNHSQVKIGRASCRERVCQYV